MPCPHLEKPCLLGLRDPQVGPEVVQKPLSPACRCRGRERSVERIIGAKGLLFVRLEDI
jgi:hypothetical protein